MAESRNGFLQLVDAFFIAFINAYQKYLSPRKGWRCAYGTLHGGPGCSGFAKSAIQAHGWREARPLVRQRFQHCKMAAQQLRAQQGATAMLFAAQPSRDKKKQCLSDAACDCGPFDCDACSSDGCIGEHLHCNHLSCDSVSCEGVSGDACDVPTCDCSW